MKDIQIQKLLDSLLKASNTYAALANMYERLCEDAKNETTQGEINAR